MLNVIYDLDGYKLGVYDGDNDSARIFDDEGRYLGRYFEHEIFNHEGMSRGWHNGNPLDAFKVLLLDFLKK